MDNTTKRMVKLTNDRKERDDTIRDLNKTITEKDHLYAALENENGILTDKLAKHDKAQRDGYTTYIENNAGMVIGVSNVLPYSKYTYLQELPKEVATSLYSKIPFYVMNKGQLEIDKQKYDRYKLGGLL